MRLIVGQRTAYRFSQPQQRLVQLLRMSPSSHYGQNVIDWRIDVDCDARLRFSRDGFGNETAMLYVDGPIDRIELSVHGEVLTDDRAGVIAGTIETLPPLLYLQTTPLSRADPALAAVAVDHAKGGTVLDRAHALARGVHELIEFEAKARSPEIVPATEALARGFGTSVDGAHLFVAAARAVGMPARFVAGHRFTEEGEGAPHGWAEAFVEDYGWIGFDPTCGLCPDDRYVRVAIGLDYRDAAPVSGARTGGGLEELVVATDPATPPLMDG